MPVILEVEDLVKGVSFVVEEGKVFGLLGASGAGKSTIISVVTGLLPPTAGTARVGGYALLAPDLQAEFGSAADLGEWMVANGIEPLEWSFPERNLGDDYGPVARQWYICWRPGGDGGGDPDAGRRRVACSWFSRGVGVARWAAVTGEEE